MADLHAQLLTELDSYDGTYGASKPLAALCAVVELHKPDPAWNCCDHEGTSCEWPCSTIQVIARELGVDGG